jgi:hypothetical protein
MQQTESELLQKLKVELTQHRLHVGQPEEGVAKVG